MCTYVLPVTQQDMTIKTIKPYLLRTSQSNAKIPTPRESPPPPPMRTQSGEPSVQTSVQTIVLIRTDVSSFKE